MMTTTSRRLLAAGQRLPAAVLDAVEGPVVDLHHLRHDSLVVVLGHPGCDACAAALEDLADAVPALRRWDALLAVVVADRDEAEALAARLPLAVLVDPEGRVRAGAGLEPDGAVVLVADRYGTAYRVDAVGGDHAFPTVDELGTEARYIAIQCPECSVPAWSW